MSAPLIFIFYRNIPFLGELKGMLFGDNKLELYVFWVPSKKIFNIILCAINGKKYFIDGEKFVLWKCLIFPFLLSKAIITLQLFYHFLIHPFIHIFIFLALPNSLLDTRSVPVNKRDEVPAPTLFIFLNKKKDFLEITNKWGNT